MKDDTVSRAAVIETIKSHFRVDNDLLEVIVYEVAHLPAGQTYDDAVSRQTAIDALSTPHGILYPIRTVEELPSVQPETAKRIVGKSRDGMTLWYQCDMCNEPVDAQDNFCRGCGRRLTDG